MLRQINVVKLVMCLLGDLTNVSRTNREAQLDLWPGVRKGGGRGASRVFLTTANVSSRANLSVGGGAAARSEKVSRSWS